MVFLIIRLCYHSTMHRGRPTQEDGDEMIKSILLGMTFKERLHALMRCAEIHGPLTRVQKKRMKDRDRKRRERKRQGRSAT